MGVYILKKILNNRMCLGVISLFLVISFALVLPAPLAEAVSSDAEILWAEVYDGLKNHDSRIDASTGSILSGDFLEEAAIEDNDGKRMGDFYYFESLKSYQGSYTWDWKGNCDYHFQMKYRYSKSKMVQFNKKLKRVMKSLHLSGKNNRQKVIIIHDYIIDHVRYVDSGNDLQYTAAGALLNGKAVCEGYSLLFYRMCKEAGVPVRFITGTAYDSYGVEAHAWNIVKINGKWYNMDVTWDDDSENQFFLQSDEDFEYHMRDAVYQTNSFYKKHPMAQNSIEHP